MRPTNEPGEPAADASRQRLLHRTRRSVLDVLLVTGVMIAASGWLLRSRGDEVPVRTDRNLSYGLVVGLVLVALVSHTWRRASARGAAVGTPDERAARFYRSHVGPAAVAALGVPLGLAYGGWVDSRLGSVAPFWVVPLALGFLAWPRRAELDDFDSPSKIEAPSP